MNWFTQSIIVGSSGAAKKELAEQDSACEHVEKDIDLAYGNHRENDSFGTVGSYVCCKACHEKIMTEKGEEKCSCSDCKQVVKRSEGFRWRWYDFYAPQGDVALFICDACKDKPTHVARVQRDDADRDSEFNGR
jgi:hypothetical protein